MSAGFVDWVAGPTAGWGWERREELAQALASETMDWLEDYGLDEPTWELLYRGAIAQGTARPDLPAERRIEWADAAVRGETAPEGPGWTHGEREAAIAGSAALLASAWALGGWDWIVGEYAVYLGGDLIALDPEHPHGSPGLWCSCGATRDPSACDCPLLLLAAILRGALGAPGRAIAPSDRPSRD